MEAVSTAQDLSNTFTCCEPCIKNARCRKAFLIITFILVTFDLVTDWINWKQWSQVGGYSFHHLVYIFTTAFLCVASVGTVLWTIETFIIVMKFYLIHKSTKNPPDEREKYVETLTTDSEQETTMQETEISPQILRVDKNKQEQILDETVNCPDQLKDVTEKHDKPEKLVEKVREETDENKTELDQTEISQQNVRDDTDDHQPDKKTC